MTEQRHAPEQPSDQYIFDVARYVGISGTDIEAFIKTLAAVGYHVTPIGDDATPASDRATLYQRGERVLVDWDSGHIEECTVQDVVVWVKDATGHSYEREIGKVRRIGPSAQNDAATSGDTCPICEKAALKLRFDGTLLTQDCMACGTTCGNAPVIDANAAIAKARYAAMGAGKTLEHWPDFEKQLASTPCVAGTTGKDAK